MYARVTRFRGSPDQIAKGIEVFREHVIPWLRDAEGFRGWFALLDRAGGRSVGVTFWATEQAAQDTPESGAELRDEIADAIGATMEALDIYEVVAADELDLDRV